MKQINQKLERIPNRSGIYRVKTKYQGSDKWTEPKRGGKFLVAKPVKGVDGIRRRIKKTFSTFAEAIEFKNSVSEDGVINRLYKDLPLLSEVQRMMFSELVTKWKLTWLPNKAESTQIRYLSYLKHFDYLMYKKVDEIKPTDIDEWICYLKRKEYLALCHSTRCDYKHEYSVLRRIFNFYSERFNRDYRLPFLKDHKTMLKVREKPQGAKKDLSVEELKKFLVALREICEECECEGVYYLAILQYGLFCRVQEAAALHVEDFDMSRGKVLINKKVVWLRKKGLEDRIESGNKKNGGKELLISDYVLVHLREWQIKSGIRSGLLFRGKSGGPFTYRQIEHRYTRALKLAGLPFSATHILRHASLTEGYNACNDLLAVAKLAGHSDLRSTQKYAKVRDDKVDLVQKKMDEKLMGITF